ncbi:sulfhydryl oxidase [Hemileuca sp. nucleopolyhedrovirus]|uniref:Sulfhydryl oxidase n=1 Tax=Hemileuca sp. nucleopolyhedrovirus TaxID=1367203 RepID=S5MQ84_9ABAC|nr:sulfhydryl oxidase [Hemileuca sp. nucleopolyhedrovirus]AGR56833.1 sulfhydryl oxidase [Hemileuca sp. nucleopolyhedrovirus]
MIPLTPLYYKYIDSFFLYTFRYMNKIRTLESKDLITTLTSELTYLYNIASLIKYKEVQTYEIKQLIDWLTNLDANLDLEQIKLEFNDKIIELNLRAFQPKNYTYTFETIWNVIHFLALIIDDMFENRQNLTYEFVTYHLSQMKAIYYNLFFKLECAMCRDHYLNIKGFLIISIERMEICLNRERFGEHITMVEEIDIQNSTRNTLMRHGVLYSSMVLHNHINEYRWVQRKVKPPVDAFKMEWNQYKKMLGLN